MVEQDPVKIKVTGSSPVGGATVDGKRKKRFCQRVLLGHNQLNYHLVLGSEVSTSKVAVFLELQNFEIARKHD